MLEDVMSNDTDNGKQESSASGMGVPKDSPLKPSEPRAVEPPSDEPPILSGDSNPGEARDGPDIEEAQKTAAEEREEEGGYQ